MDANQSNLAKSELVLARILSLLMEHGLKGSTLTFGSLNLDSDYEPYFKTCFLWLLDEGLVRSRTNLESISSVFHAYDPVLTAKGFSFLGSHLQVDNGQVSLAKIVEDKASSTGMYTGVGDFLGGLFGGFTKSISS
jgi:hypothetical protein